MSKLSYFLKYRGDRVAYDRMRTRRPVLLNEPICGDSGCQRGCPIVLAMGWEGDRFTVHIR